MARHNQKFTKDQVYQIYEEYRTGESTISLGKKYGVSQQTISNNFQKYGLKLRGQSDIRIRFDEHQTKMIINLHKELGTKFVLKKFGISGTCLKRILKENGITLCYGEFSKINVSEDRRNSIIGLYKLGLSGEDIAELYPFSVAIVRSVIRDAGIELRGCDSSSCTANDSYFDVVGHEQAYWIGYLYADGTLSDRMVAFTQCEKYKESVYKFKRCLFLSNDISVVEKHVDDKVFRQYCIRTGSKRIIEKLKGYGICPNKTYEGYDKIVEFFNSLDDLNKRAFISGLLDGDGSVGYYKYVSRWNICSTNHKLLLSIREFLSKNGVSYLNISERDRGGPILYTLGTSASNARDVIVLLRGAIEKDLRLSNKYEKENKIIKKYHEK